MTDTSGNPAVSYKLDGADELVEILTRLGNLGSQALFDGAMAGGKVIADEANRLAPGPGIVAEPEEVGPGYVTVAIGPEKKRWYYLFIETGTTEHEIPRRPASEPPIAFAGTEGEVFERAMHPGIAARPFLRPAVDGKQQAAFDAVGKTIAEFIDAAAK